MPLLKTDRFGNTYEYGFGSKSREADVTGDDDNVVYGEYGKHAAINRELARRKEHKKKQQIQAMKNHEQKVLARNKAKADTKKLKAQEQERKRNQRFVAEQNKRFMTASRDSKKNPFNSGFQKVGSGSELVGFKEKAHYVARKDIGKGPIRGVTNAQANGNTMLREHNWPVRNRRLAPQAAKNKFSSPSRYYNSVEEASMGGWKKIRRKIRKLAPRVVTKNIKGAAKITGRVINAPLKLTHKIATTVPGLKHVYKGVDKLTGGTITSLYRTVTLPGRAIETGKLSKADLIEGVMNVVKVGAIIVSGGSAVAVIGAAAGALKSGPLGKTSFGNALLSFGEVAGLAYAGKVGIAKALQSKAKDMATAKAATEVGKKAGPLGAIAASAAVSVGAAGLNTPGGKIPVAATANSAKQATQVSMKAATEAAKKLATSGLQFSTAAAKAEAEKIVIAEAKSIVAKEFQNRTGVPLSLAVKVFEGKVPSPAQIQKDLKKELTQAPEKLKEALAKIPDQKKLADMAMKKVLEEKEKIYQREIVQRLNDVEKIKDITSKELVSHNLIMKAKAEVYMAKNDELKKLSDNARSLRERASNEYTNMSDAKNLSAQALAMEQKVMAQALTMKPEGDELAAMSIKSELITQDGAARLVIAEYGGKTKYTEGTGNSELSDLRHPMLSYGLV